MRAGYERKHVSSFMAALGGIQNLIAKTESAYTYHSRKRSSVGICLAVSTLTAPSLSLKGDSHTEDRVYHLSERYLCVVSEWISLVACGGDIWP